MMNAAKLMKNDRKIIKNSYAFEKTSDLSAGSGSELVHDPKLFAIQNYMENKGSEKISDVLNKVLRDRAA